MKVEILGGGPAGLYSAILLKKAWPQTLITVWERNRPDDTFGFGVVFSDETLQTFEAYDRESYRAITDNFAYWDDIEIHFRGTVHRLGGNGFCGCSRATLLRLLQERARSLGVTLRFRTEITDLEALAGDADLLVAADGANSRVREQYAASFKPEIDWRPNKFSWMGSTRPLDAFNFFFRETEHGIFIAHCYQYEVGRSTWVMETDPETFISAGLDRLDEQQSARYLEQVFAAELHGHKLITNRSVWRSFPTIRCGCWTSANMVLIGDAKATAHFSIGSGTKLAMEDAIALHNAFEATGGKDVAAALAHFEMERRADVERTQHSADVSLVWFEQVKRFWSMPPTRFVFGLMTRAKAITYDNLALRAPGFIDEVDALVAREVQRQGFDVDIEKPAVPMFQPYRLRNMVVPNRVVVSPMDQYSAVDGLPNDWHLVHLGARAVGGAGLIYTEMVCVSPEARITLGCSGLYNDTQEAQWRHIVDFIKANTAAKICLQLGHAGRKGGTKLMWEGMDRPLSEGAWPVISASPLPYHPDSQVPREMTRADMDNVIADFVAAAQRGAGIGFDMLELHCAHGYLAASFISPLTNVRTDAYGGPLENRLRFPLALFRAVRAVWPAERPMSVRISATDWKEGGLSGADSIEVARRFGTAGADLIHVSTGQTVPDAEPVFGRMFQTPFSEAIRNETGIPTIAVGAITTADQVNTIVAAGRADLVAIGRPHLVDPSFTMKAAAWYGAPDIYCPPQYFSGRDQLFRNSEREHAEMMELRRRAKPKAHAGTWRKAAE
jgi:anthraniloyl-CoA monooxygenase